MKTRLHNLCLVALAVFFVGFTAFQCLYRSARADDGGATEEFFVSIHDGDAVLTVKTSEAPVSAILGRSDVVITETDVVEPSLGTHITSARDIYIHRARPVIMISGVDRRYIMTAASDLREVAQDAGFAVSDGDTIISEPSSNFLEAGVAVTYRLVKGNSEAASDNSAADASLANQASGATSSAGAGAGADNSDNFSAAPVIPPERAGCAEWARAAGVSDADLEVALELIYHESHCRVDATNQSSGAYGIPQALPGFKMASEGDDWETNPVTQIRWMQNYVTRRYGGWHQAMDWWWAHYWY